MEITEVLVKGDLLTGEGLREAVGGADAIIHAAQSPSRLWYSSRCQEEVPA